MGSMSSLRAAACAFVLACTGACAAEPVRIGIISGLTDFRAGATQGTSLRAAALAVEEVNREGGVLGRPLVLVSEDNQNTTPGTVVAASKLLADPAIAAIILPLESGGNLAVLPAIARRGIPAMAPGTHHAITHANNPWIFRVRANASYVVRAIADFGVNTLKKTKWAIVHTVDAIGIDCRDRLLGDLNGLGVTPLAVSGINADAQNFAPAVQAIRNTDAEVVASCSSTSATVGYFARQLREAGVDAVLIGSSTTSTTEARRIAGEALYGAYSAVSYVEDSSPTTKEFARKYMQRWSVHGDEQSSGPFYDAVRLLAVVMNKAGSTEPGAVRDELMKTRGHVGVSGTFSFDEYGDGLHSISIVRNEGGKLVSARRMSYEPRP
jgi:branched-chain amino acid transport system substrate-binding protein